MSTFGPSTICSMGTTADLSGHAYCLVKLNGDRQVTNCSASSDVAIGVLTDGVADGSGGLAGVSVAIEGIAKVLTGAGNLAVGHLGTSDGSGKGVTAGSGNKFIGRCVAAANENEIAEVLLYRGVIP